MAFQIESHSPHSGLIQAQKFVARSVGVQHHYTTSVATHLFERVNQATIVRAVEAGLDDYRTLKANTRQMRAQVSHRRNASRVRSIRQHGVATEITHHMNVAIAGKRGNHDQRACSMRWASKRPVSYVPRFPPTS